MGNSYNSQSFKLNINSGALSGILVLTFQPNITADIEDEIQALSSLINRNKNCIFKNMKLI